jgi:hypothetical protein
MDTIPVVPADVEQILEANEPKIVPVPVDTVGGTNPRDETAGCPTGLDSAPASGQEVKPGRGAKAKKPQK